MFSIRRLPVGPVLLALLLAFPGPSRALQSQLWPQTGAEGAAWARSTSHAEMLAFLSDVQTLSDRMLVRQIGSSEEGRAIPAVFLGDPVVASPGVGSRSDKPTLLVTGSIHGDEPVGTEGALHLIRELALGDGQELLHGLDVIIVPQMNPDGAEAGVRENARGYDLNRDWVTAETPEVSAVLEQVVARYWPDVFLDVHNGGSFPYDLNFQTTLEPAADLALVELARGPLFDFIEQRLDSRRMRMFWYSGPVFEPRTDSWYWRTTQPLPRKHHSYAGLQDMVALLFEIPEEQAPDVAAAVAREAMLGLAEFLAQNADDVKTAIREARRRTMVSPPAEISLELEARAYPESESFYVVPASENDAPNAPRLVEGENRTRYLATRVRPTPWGYLFNGSIEEVALLLRRHGIQVERLGRAATVPVQRYRMDQITRARDRYQRHLMNEVVVELDSGFETLPAGTFLVRVRQPAGRLIPQLLEPDAVDSLVRWNLLDAHLPLPGRSESFLPIYRLEAHPGVPTTLLP